MEKLEAIDFLRVKGLSLFLSQYRAVKSNNPAPRASKQKF